MLFEKDKKLNSLSFKHALVMITYTVILIWVILHAGEVWNTLRNILSLLTPFIYGLVFAFLFNQPMKWILKHLSPKITKGRKLIAALLSLILIIGTLTFIVWIVLPLVVENIRMLAEAFPGYIEDAIAMIEDLMSRNIIPADLVTQLETYVHELENILMNVLKNGLPKIIDFASSFASSIANIVMGIVIAIYLTLSKEKLLRQLNEFTYAFTSEKVYAQLKKIGRLTNDTFSSFVSGQLLESLIIGILCYIGCLIFQFPYAPIVSVIIGCTNIIPIFGAILGVGLSALLILFVDPFQGVLFVGFGILLQQLESNLIYPRVVGNTVGLSGLWVLLSISIGGGLFGAAGMLLGLPVFSIVYSLLREEMHARSARKRALRKEHTHDLSRITNQNDETAESDIAHSAAVSEGSTGTD